MHCFITNQLFDQRSGAIPGDAPQVQKADIEPGRKHVLHLHIQRLKPLVSFQAGQHVGTQIHQKTDATRKGTKALQQAPTRRHRGTAQTHFGNRLVRRADSRRILGLGQAGFFWVGYELLTHQQPHVAALVGTGAGVPVSHPGSAAAALDLADLWVHDGFEFLKRTAQHARRQGFFLLPQDGTQALSRAAQWSRLVAGYHAALGR